MGSFWDDLETQWNIAEGVRDSGVVSVIQNGLEVVRDGVDGLASAAMAHAALSERGFDAVCSVLARQTGVLERLENILGNPRGTQADELFRRGRRALNAGWLEEAAKELAESVELDPYVPQAQFALGVVKGALNDPTASGQAFARAVRYSSDMPHLVPLGAGAGVLGCRAFIAGADLDSAKHILEEARRRTHDCPELDLLAGRLLGDTAAIEHAFNLAPEVIPLAFAERLAGADMAFASVLSSGTLKAMRDADLLWERIGGPRAEAVSATDPKAAALSYVRWANTVVPQMRVAIGAYRAEFHAA